MVGVEADADLLLAVALKSPDVVVLVVVGGLVVVGVTGRGLAVRFVGQGVVGGRVFCPVSSSSSALLLFDTNPNSDSFLLILEQSRTCLDA